MARAHEFHTKYSPRPVLSSSIETFLLQVLWASVVGPDSGKSISGCLYTMAVERDWALYLIGSLHITESLSCSDFKWFRDNHVTQPAYL